MSIARHGLSDEDVMCILSAVLCGRDEAEMARVSALLGRAQSGRGGCPEFRCAVSVESGEPES